MQGNFALKISLQLMPKFWHLHLINAKDASAASDNDIHFAEDISQLEELRAGISGLGL